MNNSPIHVGLPAPRVQLGRISGETVALADLWKSQPILLFFLRHFGCAICRAHLRQIARAYPQILEHGGTVAAITFADTASAAYLQSTQDVPFPLLLDLPRRAYRAFGMLDGSLSDVISPRILVQQLRQIRHGHVPYALPGSNIRQLGGSVIIDTSGIVQFHHPVVPTDNYPTIDQYLAILNRLEKSLQNRDQIDMVRD